MIVGIGMDLVELDRIKQAITKEKFVKRILTPDEYQVFQGLNPKRQVEFAAGRFAAKEAFSKARGTGIGQNLSWQDVSILNNHHGKPILKASLMENEYVHVSLSHTRQTASAFVIIESLSG